MEETKPKLSFALILKKGISPSEISQITSPLDFNNVGYYLRQTPFSDNQIMLLYAKNFEDLLKEAERIRIFKPKINKKSFNEEYVKSLPEGPYKTFISVRKSLDKKISALEKLSAFSYSNLSKFTHETDFKIICDSLFDSEEYLRIFHSFLKRIEIKGENLFFFDFLERKKLIEEIIPLHDDEANPYKSKTYKKNRNLKKYLGEQCAYYFYFLSYLQKWLIIPAIIGFIVVIFNRAFNEDVDESPFESLYSAFMVFWAACFVIFWEKKQNSLNYKWRCFGRSIGTHENLNKITENNTQNALFEQVDPVSGNKLLIYPQSKRILRYLESFLISLPILLCTLLFLVFSLNLRGYVSKDHPTLYIEFISNFSKDGEMFDQNSFMANIPVLFHVIVLFNINMFYSNISKWTSKREFHKTVQGEENSLIVKRVVFETFNTFVDLIYLAFIKLDISAVRRELISIYTFDELRRIVTETVIPFLIRKFKESKIKNSLVKVKTFDADQKTEEIIEKKILETTYAKYEGFDDYLEIVINFAYITLFASAFPLAPALILMFHYLESLSDRYKVLNVYQRPMAERGEGIGSWLGVLRIISILSVLSNIVRVFERKNERIFPFLFKIYHHHVQGKFFQVQQPQKHLLEADIKSGMGRYVVLIVFVIEHICFIGFWMIKKWEAGREDWTGVYRKRKEFKLKLSKMKAKN